MQSVAHLKDDGWHGRGIDALLGISFERRLWLRRFNEPSKQRRPDKKKAGLDSRNQILVDEVRVAAVLYLWHTRNNTVLRVLLKFLRQGLDRRCHFLLDLHFEHSFLGLWLLSEQNAAFVCRRQRAKFVVIIFLFLEIEKNENTSGARGINLRSTC